MNIEHITKAVIFDFDDTLINVPEPEEGKAIWKEKTGTDWPYPGGGWWSKPESLSMDIYDIKPHSDMLAEYNKVSNDSSTFVALATGRMKKLANEVHAILRKYNIAFDDIVLNGDARYNVKGQSNDTLTCKIRFLNDVVKNFINLKELVFWDDRVEHHNTFVTWKNVKEAEQKNKPEEDKIKITINLVKR